MRVPGFHRYRVGARVYDILSLERPLYRSGRMAAISGLRLRPGDRVLDVGCGTGLNFVRLVDAVGPSGEVVGVDVSPAMLRQARRRIAGHGWPNVTVVEGDVARLVALVDGRFDAVLFTYSLAVVGQWRQAWAQATGMLRVGGRVAVVDTARPTGWWRLLSPVARLAMFTGGVDPSREVWKQVIADTVDSSCQVLKGGHVHVAAGTRATTQVGADQ